MVVALVLCRVLVGLPSGSYCSSGLRGSVVFLVCMLGHLSLVRSVFFLSPRSWYCSVPVPPGVLPGGPCCVLTLQLSLALSRVLHCPLLGFSVASPALARGLGLSFVPYPLFCRLWLVPRSVAQLCTLQLLVPSFRVYLSEAAGFGGFLVLSIVLP